MELRWYQEEAIEETLLYLDEEDGNPLIILPTGAGKSLTMCGLIDDYITEHPTRNVLIISHIAEILQQDHKALEKYFHIDIGLYSSGLNSRTIKKITVAGIQSIYSKPDLFNNIDLILVDESHMIPTNGEGMYRTFLNHFKGVANIVGLTATDHRLGHGYIHKGKGALFDGVSYDISRGDKFNKLVDEGFLSKLISKNTTEKLDPKGVKLQGGEFNQKELSKKLDRDSITESAVSETIKFGKNYLKWLIFAIDINHAEHIYEKLKSKGIPTAIVHSKMKESRQDVIEKFKKGRYRAMVNVDILTTGFDVPDIDLIALMRPTQSAALHVQMVGRGLRVAPKKDHCLVLDFAGNTMRLGPINDVVVKERGKSKGGDPIVKECPECEVINHGSARFCYVCGYKFEFKEKLQQTASNVPIVKNTQNLKKWLKVDEVMYSVHSKPGKPDSLRVKYVVGFMAFSEWICIDHQNGFARANARHWVNYRWTGNPHSPPRNLRELIENTDKLKSPKTILVNQSKKFPSIDDYTF